MLELNKTAFQKRTVLKVGTRESKLSLTQTKLIIDALMNIYPSVQFEIITIKTEGDIRNDIHLSEISGKGVFVKEIESALLNGEIDFAVHSLKDMLTTLPDGLKIGCIPKREDPSDVIVLSAKSEFRRIENFPAGFRIGTCSLRRAAQLKHYKTGLEILPIRGNIDTRINKLRKNNYDAIILAAAGINRMKPDMEGLRIIKIPYQIMLPAPGQGALAIETRIGDLDGFFSPLECRKTTKEITAERILLEKLGGGCKTPVGCLAQITPGQLFMASCVCNREGTVIIRKNITGKADNPEKTAEMLFDLLIKNGADKLLNN